MELYARFIVLVWFEHLLHRPWGGWLEKVSTRNNKSILQFLSDSMERKKPI